MLPILDSWPENRLIERAICSDVLTKLNISHDKILAGNDSRRVCDCYVVKDDAVTMAIEIGGYIFTGIQDIRDRYLRSDGVMVVDIGKCSKIHDSQPDPYTIIQKKILQGKEYLRHDKAKKCLIIHSDVCMVDGQLAFHMIGPMQMSPSTNYYSHNRSEILAKLITAVNSTDHGWDHIWLIDYTEYVVPDPCIPQVLF